MNLPFRGRYITDEVMDEIEAEANLTGDSIRAIIIQEVAAAGLLWRKERNVRGVNEHPFDLAIGNEATLEMCGIEIKGDTDNFSRLPRQLSAYQFTFPEIYLAVHKKKLPAWLPEGLGILRIADGKVFVQQRALIAQPLDISTEYEWDAIMRANGLGRLFKPIRENLKILGDVRNNIIFNRFFGELAPGGIKKYEKFYPLTDQQIRVAMGWNLEAHFKTLKTDVRNLESRLRGIKAIMAVGREAEKQLPLFDKDGE